jgi:NAD(P)-dependent dehydrogenase (short-subunit alcohol dehydrogenase family)
MYTKVYMVCRNEQRGSAAREDIIATIQDKGGVAPELMIADVGLKADVLRIAAEFASKEQRLDGLVCNAGACV